MPPTIREVALRAGVSVSTVSRVLNDYPFVSEDARRRVLEAMEALDYRPDVAARSMRTGTSRAIGFVVADIGNPLFATIAKGADAVLHPHGYSLVLANSQNDAGREAELLSTLRQRRVDGIILAAADERAPGLAAQLEGFATVLFDREVEGSGADAVLSDHDTGTAQALEHLARLGHRRVGLISGSLRQLGSRARVLAFRRHARRLHFAFDPALVQNVDPSHDGGYRAARELLGLADPPSGLVIAHSQITAGVIEAIHDMRLQLPADLSLVVCDDIDVTRLHSPQIDVIERDLVEHGRAAARVLLERLEDRDAPPRRLLLPTRLILRESSAAPAKRLAERAS